MLSRSRAQLRALLLVAIVFALASAVGRGRVGASRQPGATRRTRSRTELTDPG